MMGDKLMIQRGSKFHFWTSSTRAPTGPKLMIVGGFVARSLPMESNTCELNYYLVVIAACAVQVQKVLRHLGS